MENIYLLEAMNGIVNTRRYLDRPIPERIEEELFYAFSLGPSMANTQPWELIVTAGQEQRKKVVDATLDPFLTEGSYGGQPWIAEAPLLFVVCIEKRRALARLGEAGMTFAMQDAFGAIQNFRLLAAMHGLCTASVREFDAGRLRDSLELPWYMEPVAIITAGYSEEEKEIPPRLPISEIVHKGKWQ
ncbi:nitroreductase [Caldalkalibacillus thermarum]|uniref:nitroreductase family protein n=1 Tax=Caldalkalibacillus thermarum TaxID=296745 RepID=UPI00166AEA93|nr:nitroreductase family protein [Caldalkalibacillus thermarum]GGK35062.1 nitroreductase [Caldalkalibacillus thermarum]